MKVEIDEVREIKEIVISSDGKIPIRFPELSGHIAKIVILDKKMEMNQPKKTLKEEGSGKSIEQLIEGRRYIKGQRKSRQTAKNFKNYISQTIGYKESTQSWIILEGGISLRYANSVIYEGSEGDYLWYSLFYDRIIKHLEKTNIIICFLIRESKKLVYIPLDEILKELKKARDLRQNDWLHIHLIFSLENIKLRIKSGRGNEPIEKIFNRNKHYVKWEEFSHMLKRKYLERED